VIWFLVLVGILLIVLGVWGGPRRRKRPDKASRIPKEATVQEAWEILTSPVEYEEELIKIPEHKPWFVPRGDRRFYQGLLVGLGLGLMAASVLLPFLPRKAAPDQAASLPPAGQAGKQPEAQQPAETQKPAENPKPAGTQQPAQTTPPKGDVSFTVEPGSSSQEIAAQLKAAGLIKSEQEFLDLLIAYGLETKLKAGTFVIPSDASVDDVIKKLTE
jgi:hypothetical protein